METMRAKLFKNGGSQAVRLPQEVRFPEGATEVLVRREGRRVILEPADEWPEEFLAMLGTWAEDLPRWPQEPLQESRAFREEADPARPRPRASTAKKASKSASRGAGRKAA
jgi:antitoxin VapB